jgi:putative tryptophan/tyrosine transport system substrate-binding protein
MRCTTVGCLLLLALFVASTVSGIQPIKKVPTIGILLPGSPPTRPDWKQSSVFLQELHHLGWRENENLTVEYRWTAGQFYRGDDLAAELVGLPVDVLLVQGRPLIQAVQRATTTLPIVMIAAANPETEGFIASHVQPGGNITGVDASIGTELNAKRLDLLKEAVPAVTRIAVLVHPIVPATGEILEELKEVAGAIGVQLHILAVYHPYEFPEAFETATREGAGALLILSSLFFNLHQHRLAALAVKHRLPTMAWAQSFVTAGGLLAYGPQDADLWRRAAYYVDRLLKGTKPADLPVERPTTFELVINLKTAQDLGLTIPPLLLFQATEVIR